MFALTNLIKTLAESEAELSVEKKSYRFKKSGLLENIQLMRADIISKLNLQGTAMARDPLGPEKRVIANETALLSPNLKFFESILTGLKSSWWSEKGLSIINKLSPRDCTQATVAYLNQFDPAQMDDAVLLKIGNLYITARKFLVDLAELAEHAALLDLDVAWRDKNALDKIRGWPPASYSEPVVKFLNTVSPSEVDVAVLNALKSRACRNDFGQEPLTIDALREEGVQRFAVHKRCNDILIELDQNKRQDDELTGDFISTCRLKMTDTSSLSLLDLMHLEGELSAKKNELVGCNSAKSSHAAVNPGKPSSSWDGVKPHRADKTPIDDATTQIERSSLTDLKQYRIDDHKFQTYLSQKDVKPADIVKLIQVMNAVDDVINGIRGRGGYSDLKTEKKILAIKSAITNMEIPERLKLVDDEGKLTIGGDNPIIEALNTNRGIIPRSSTTAFNDFKKQMDKIRSDCIKKTPDSEVPCDTLPKTNPLKQ